MIKTATAINSFAHVAQQADVSPIEEPIFVLTRSQLKQIIQEATQPSLDRVSSLEVIIARQDEIRAKFEALEKDQTILAENQLIQLRLINDLRKDKEPQPLQRDRREILRALIATNGGKMLLKDARKTMRLSKQNFTRVLASISDHITVKPYHLDRRQSVLTLK